MKSDTNIAGRQARTVWFVVIALVALLFAFVVWKSASMAKMMSTAAASDMQDFSRSAVGSSAKFVLEIAEASSEGKIRGKLLRKKTEEIYTRTATAVTAQSNSQTKIVMGNPADVHAGAVVHVTGTVQKDQVIAADQIVILTGYVKVQSE
jgi:malate/lactate dehydrogenase